MARSRKTPAKGASKPGTDDTGKPVEDAVVIEEGAASDPAETPAPDDTPGVLELKPEDAVTDAPGSGAAIDAGADASGEDTPKEADAPAEEPPAEAAAGDTEAPEAEPDAVEPDPSRAAAAAPRPAEPQGSGAGSVIALIFGGVVAAGVGFAASRYVFPDGWPGQGGSLSEAVAALDATAAELRGAVEDQSGQIRTLGADISTLQGTVSELSARDPGVDAVADSLGARIDGLTDSASGLQDRISELETALGTLTGQVEEIALRPMPEALDTASLNEEIARFRADLSAAVDEARAELAAIRDDAAAREAEAQATAAEREAAAEAEAERLRAEAEAAAAAAVRRAAVARVVAAIENGEPFAEDLAELPGADVPEALSTVADSGVRTLGALQDAFPAAARDALDASIRASTGDTAMERFTAFLRVQTGARSLEPKEGDDPDAVLSRAEAALGSGDIAASLAELAALPEPGLQAMSDWTASARARMEAVAAAQALAETVTTN